MAGKSDSGRSVLKHISPVTWDNVIIYGEYVIDPDLIRL